MKKPEVHIARSTRRGHSVRVSQSRQWCEELHLIWFRVEHGFRGVNLLKVALGLIFTWFGILKFFPNLSPAEVLAQQTIDKLTFGLIGTESAIMMLAFLETLIGICLLVNVCRRYVIMIAVAHLCCTFIPVFVFPEQIFGESLFTLTLTGQYIVKNIILIGALLTIRELPGEQSIQWPG